VAGLAGSAGWSWRVSMVFRTKRAKVLAVGAVAGVAAALTRRAVRAERRDAHGQSGGRW
jgi:hypothetical protein